jgi:RHH-type proline utilization regulon transcriptional repressor/proline dehydrogenase/delta 1-pyrroline-5-carboxylate dehydrogenase
MRTLVAPGPAPALEPRVREIGRRIAAAQARAGRSRARVLEDRGMEWLARDPALKAALFRLVDVAPACAGPRDVAAHLASLLGELERPLRGAARRPLAGRVAGLAVQRMARRFIVGETPADAAGTLQALWVSGAAASVDLLGEATVTAAEADRYARRCDAALGTLATAARRWPRRERLERDAHGPIPRVNLSVKVTALTARVRAEAPELGIEDAAHRLRMLLRTAKRVGAHLHVDMESMDSRDLITELVLRLLAEPEFEDGPSAGTVLQAYLRDADEQLDRLLDGYERELPLTIRLVKGAYWEHETVEAHRHGWVAPVFEHKRESDRNFERLTRRLIGAENVRPAIASHNVRSLAHALALSDDVELQVLRGLGDDLQEALAGMGLRVRTYCPVGDLVAGMSYLVRRLLENTSNDSFLVNRNHEGLETLLAAP